MFIKNKYLFIVVVLVLLLVPNKVLAGTTQDSFKESFIGSYSFVDSTGHYGNFEHFTRKSDGKTAYCIQPGISLSKDVYDGFYNLPCLFGSYEFNSILHLPLR